MGMLVTGVIIVVGSLIAMMVISGSNYEEEIIERLNDYDY